MRKKNRTPALAYLRTSSPANVGQDKDSDKRQRQAIEAFAKSAGFEIVGEFLDQAVSGADPLNERPCFAAMLERIAGNGARIIIVETADRFARDPVVQETGHRMLKGKGIEIIAADSPGTFVDDTPTATFVRQVLGAVAEHDCCQAERHWVICVAGMRLLFSNTPKADLAVGMHDVEFVKCIAVLRH